MEKTQNDLALKQILRKIGPVVFAVSPAPDLCSDRRLDRRTGGRTMSNTIVTDHLLAAEATN